MKTLIWKEICTPMFIIALFTTVKIWREPKILSIEEWIKKLSCTHVCIQEYYAAIKRDALLPLVTTWMNLEAIMLSEVS